MATSARLKVSTPGSGAGRGWGPPPIASRPRAGMGGSPTDPKLPSGVPLLFPSGQDPPCAGGRTSQLGTGRENACRVYSDTLKPTFGTPPPQIVGPSSLPPARWGRESVGPALALPVVLRAPRPLRGVLESWMSWLRWWWFS